MDRVYLDWNATAPLRPQARAAMLAAMDAVGNPSSVHGEGRAVRRLVEDAREKVAFAVGAEPRNVIFTSGGSEANALALEQESGTAGQRPGCCDAAIVSDLEHVSVQGWRRLSAPAGVDQFDAGRDGVAQLEPPARPAQGGQRQGQQGAAGGADGCQQRDTA